MTHPELVERAGRWLKNTLNCRVVLSELVAYTGNGEIPDSIGWVNGRCILVECKTSRSDFFADLKKPFRRMEPIPAQALGDWRFYLTTEGLIDPEEIPDGWGLYEVRGRSVKHAGGVRYANGRTPPYKSYKQGEVAMLVSAISRINASDCRTDERGSADNLVQDDFPDGGQRASCPVEGSTLPPPDGFNMDEIKHKAYLYDVIMEMLGEEGVRTDGIHVPSTFKKMARIFNASADGIDVVGDSVKSLVGLCDYCQCDPCACDENKHDGEMR